jgi:hypothetical protein
MFRAQARRRDCDVIDGCVLVFAVALLVMRLTDCKPVT